MAGHRRAEATPSFGRLCPAMTKERIIFKWLETARKCWLHFESDSQGYQRKTIRAFALFWQPDSSHIPAMANNPHHPKKPVKTPKSKALGSKASRPDVQPIGPALAELLNPAINRGEAGVGSTTGLQPPPDNSWDRRSGGEAAAHRARASTRGTSDDVAKRDAALTSTSRASPPPNPPPQAGEGSRRLAERDDASSSPPPARLRGGEGLGVGGGAASTEAAVPADRP